jgi:hypothetical protein
VKYLIFIFLAGCAKDGIQTEKTTNPNIKVELLLEHDECKVYRFMDSHWVYFTKCGETSNLVNCGKNCTRVQRNIK